MMGRGLDTVDGVAVPSNIALYDQLTGAMGGGAAGATGGGTCGKACLWMGSLSGNCG
jgi:hypothetical protein